MDADLILLLLVCALLIVPRALQRARIPAPLTCLLFGLAAAFTLRDWQSGAVHFAAVLGISSLFLHAGLEVSLPELRRQLPALIGMVAVRLLMIGLIAVLAAQLLSFAWQAAVLLALAILTSSTGFILDSLNRFVLKDAQRAVIANEAIVGELLALALMFVVLESGDVVEFGASLAALVALVVVLPLLYVALARWVIPHAPGSQFSLLVTVGLAAAFVTDKLGVEFLLGAFLAGMIAAQVHAREPSLLPDQTMHGVKLFASFFMPFYFFRNGSQVPQDAVSLEAAGIGLGLCLIIPFRALVTWQRRRASGDETVEAAQVAVALLPSVIFTLVLAHILRQRYGIPEPLYGGLLLYAFVNTLLPSLLLRVGLDESARE